MTIVHFDPQFDDDERRRRLYEGDIVMYSRVAAVEEFVAYARAQLEAAMQPHDPLVVHHHVSPEDLAALLIEFKPKFIHDAESSRLLRAVIGELGCRLDDMYVDLPKMRTSYTTGHLTSGIAYAFQPHRDTWYAGPKSQINWWFPLFPVSELDAMEFFPSRFGAAIPNNSNEYNYYEANAWRGNIAAFSGKKDTRVHPAPQPALPADEARLCLVPPVGGIMLFAGDHLHASIANTTERARYSIDFRTVNGPDARAGRGAPVIDVACAGTAIRDFRNAVTSETLEDSVVAAHETIDDVDGLVLEFRPGASS